MVKAHGLDGVQLSAYDMIKFRRMMEKPHDFLNVPPEIWTEWQNLKNIKGNKGQHDAQDAIRRAWKLDEQWGHPMIKQKIEKTHTKSIRVMDKAMIWMRMCQKLGGEVNAMKALKDKDIMCVTNPADVNKRLYIMREHVNEEAWTSANSLQGTHTWEEANQDEIEGLVMEWMDHHENGWDGILKWTEEAEPMPSEIKTLPAHGVPSVPPPQPLPMPSTDPNYNGGPTPEAKMEASIKRVLGHLCSIKSRPVSVPVLYQYKYKYQYLYKCQYVYKYQY